MGRQTLGVRFPVALPQRDEGGDAEVRLLRGSALPITPLRREPGDEGSRSPVSGLMTSAELFKDTHQTLKAKSWNSILFSKWPYHYLVIVESSVERTVVHPADSAPTIIARRRVGHRPAARATQAHGGRRPQRIGAEHPVSGSPSARPNLRAPAGCPRGSVPAQAAVCRRRCARAPSSPAAWPSPPLAGAPRPPEVVLEARILNTVLESARNSVAQF